MSDKEKDYVIDSLFCLVRDGVGLSYNSWIVWQAMARSIIRSHLPSRYDELDDIRSTMKIYQKKIEDNKHHSFDELLESANEDLRFFGSF